MIEHPNPPISCSAETHVIMSSLLLLLRFFSLLTSWLTPHLCVPVACHLLSGEAVLEVLCSATRRVEALESDTRARARA